MQFCPTCGNILLIDAKSGETNLFCRTCIYTIDVERGKAISRRVYPIQKKVDDILEDMAWGGTTEQGGKCPRCSHPKAYFKEMQTRSADEPATIFYKCENKKCGHQWNEG